MAKQLTKEEFIFECQEKSHTIAWCDMNWY